MIAEFSDKDEVGRYVDAFRERLMAGALNPESTAAASAAIGAGSTDPGEAILGALPDNNIGPSSSGEEHVSAPFFSRSPAVSLMQTSLEDEARKDNAVKQPAHRGAFAHIVGLVESFVHPEKFGTHDPDWVTRIGDATLDRLAKGNHAFNPKPAEYEIPTDDARIVVVGDWGSGLPRARAVARFMAEEIADGLSQSRPVHVIHLGDVYYSGDAVEVERRVLAEGMWPVTVEQARAGVTSWSLNGNHDMYCGGWGYFETL
ncbi:MAG: metallophosphoesterase, partial [Actinobacteria bacterium]|nr:metallophosphoesterase [Actinomycetota bacterium]